MTVTQAVHVASETAAQGYEIHIGRTEGPDRTRPMFHVEGQPEGAIRADGRVMGSYLHGLFTEDAFRAAFLQSLGAQPRPPNPELPVVSLVMQLERSREACRWQVKN